jgi:hypothetical protein
MAEQRRLMKGRRHAPEQVMRRLREAERLLGEGRTIPEAAKELWWASRPMTGGVTSTAR